MNNALDLTPWVALVREVGSFALIIYLFVDGFKKMDTRLDRIEAAMVEQQKTQVQIVGLMDRMTENLERRIAGVA